MIHEATVWLKERLHENMRIFEYGTSDTTLFFANNNVKKIISIEHDPEHFNQIESMNINYEKTKIHHILVEATKEEKPVPYSHLSFGSNRKEYLYSNFKKYVEYINRYPDEAFHIVFINGRARASCISAAIPKIKKGGYLILNHSERFEYSNAIDIFLKKVESFTASQPDMKTTIWHLK